MSASHTGAPPVVVRLLNPGEIRIDDKESVVARVAVSFAVWTMVGALALYAAAEPAAAAGQLRMYVTADGIGTIMNWTSEPARFDGYAVTSLGGLIDVAGWTPIAEQAATDPGIAATLGQSVAEALQWTPTSVAPDLIGETHLTAAGILQPGESFSLGEAFTGDWWADLTFTYMDSATGGRWDDMVWPPPACESEPLDLGGPYLWDVTVAATLVCASGPTCTVTEWSILEHPQLALDTGPSIELSWADLHSAGVGPGTHTLLAGGFTNCGTWAENTTTLTIVPEPATAVVMTAASLPLLLKRKRNAR